MNSIVEDIKARLDIVSLVGEHVDLKRAGQNFKGLCPFHAEKTPSFIVSPARQMYHCYGCHKGGDIFTFIMDYENMSFPEALSYLADKTGVEIDHKSGSSGASKGRKEALLSVYREAIAYFREGLKGSRTALTYLKERGVSEEVSERFHLGYGRHDRDSLFKLLKGKGVSEEIIRSSGLVYFGEKGPFDFFRDRLMFPIHDLQGRPIAFGGRTMSTSKDVPKYINSPDSAIFSKGNTCFGLDKAKSHITRKGYSLIVEGYLDVIMCHQYGFEQAVAPLGTALTPDQLRKLKRFADKTLLVFDGDSAGIAATKRALVLTFQEGLTAKVLLLPQGEDPDSFLRKHGAERLKKHMSAATSAVEFLIKNQGRDRLEAVRQALAMIAGAPDTLQRNEALRELADRSQFNESALREELRKMTGKSAGSTKERTRDRPLSGGFRPAALCREEAILLNIALTMPEKGYAILEKLNLNHLEHPAVRGIFEKIKALPSGQGGDGPDLGQLLGTCGGEEQTLITKHSLRPEIDEEHVDENIEGCLINIALKDLDRRIKAAEGIAGETGDAAPLRALLGEKAELRKRRLL